MLTLNLRLGIAELVLMASLVILGALVVLFIVEWPVGLVPAASYAFAMVGTYSGFRLYTRERTEAAALLEQQALDEAEPVMFRIVETRGVCPLGHGTGDVIAVDAAGWTAPVVCPEATAMLQMAARDGHVEQWCCPVYDHMLVFKKEGVAA